MNNENPNPRKAAVNLLTSVLSKHQLLEDVLDEGLKNLEPRDRALARAITSTALRRKGEMDALIRKCLDRPMPEKAERIRYIMYVGITQLLYLDIPSHAAVNDTVDLVPENSKFRGLTNAILRRVDRQGKKLLDKWDISHINCPEWLQESWTGFYGAETSSKIAKAHNFEASLDISVKTDPEKWAKKLQARLLPTGSLRRKSSGGVLELPGFDDGEWWVQDFAASLPAKLIPDLEGKIVFDICAAPGGKTAQLATAGATVIAVDRSANRLKRLKENMQRLKLDIDVITADATMMPYPKTPDVILLDAPCSSTGTIRRHPDVAYLKTAEDVGKLTNLQKRLLDHSAANLKSGGMMIYSVCSLQPEEAELQIETFLSDHPDFERMPIDAAEVGGLDEVINEKGDLRCLPFHMDGLTAEGGMDGFYASRLIKK